MPTSPPRLRVLLAAVGVAALSLLALPFPGTAEATPSSLAAGTVGHGEAPQATCGPGLPCVLPTATETSEPTPEPTHTVSPTPTPTRTRTPSASPTARRTSSPRPRSTFTVTPGSTENPVTATIGVGGVVPESPTATLAPKESSSSSSTGDKITRLLEIVLGGAVLLGLSGATGLYLTRHRHEQ